MKNDGIRWDPREDWMLLNCMADGVTSWKKMKEIFKDNGFDRSHASIRNRWQRIDKGGNARPTVTKARNRCKLCGELARGHVCFKKIMQYENSEKTFDLPESEEDTDEVVSSQFILERSFRQWTTSYIQTRFSTTNQIAKELNMCPW